MHQDSSAGHVVRASGLTALPAARTTKNEDGGQALIDLTASNDKDEGDEPRQIGPLGLVRLLILLQSIEQEGSYDFFSSCTPARFPYEHIFLCFTQLKSDLYLDAAAGLPPS